MKWEVAYHDLRRVQYVETGELVCLAATPAIAAAIVACKNSPSDPTALIKALGELEIENDRLRKGTE